MNTNYPFRQWVPKPLGALTLLLLFVPLFFSDGTYLSNINEMAGSMGTLTETFQFLSLCASIGMSMVFPFMLPYLQARNVKTRLPVRIRLAGPVKRCLRRNAVHPAAGRMLFPYRFHPRGTGSQHDFCHCSLPVGHTNA